MGEIDYQIALAIVEKLQKEGLIQEEEFEKINELMIDHFQPKITQLSC